MSKELSPQDSVSLNYVDTENRYENGQSFSSRGGFIGWAHLFSPNMTVDSSAGATVLEGQSSGLSNVQTTVAPRGNVALTWRDSTTSLSMAYGLGLSPSYQFEAQPLLTNLVTFSVTQVMLIPQLVGMASVNYGRGDEIGSTSVNAVSYTSYAATGGVLYKFTPQTFLNLTYLYANYDNQFGATNNSFDRHIVSISLAQAFY
jgi:opacity protein-like surface antigen